MSREGALWVGGLEAYMDEPFLQHCLLCMGEAAPVSIKVMKNKFSEAAAGYGFINFSNDQTALTVMHKLNGKMMPNTNPPVRWKLNHSSNRLLPGEKNHSVWVGDLTPEVDDLQLYQFFSRRFQSLVSAKVVLDESGFSKGFGFIRFSNEVEQQTAMTTMNGMSGLGGKPIKVSVAVNKIKDGMAVPQVPEGIAHAVAKSVIGPGYGYGKNEPSGPPPSGPPPSQGGGGAPGAWGGGAAPSQGSAEYYQYWQQYQAWQTYQQQWYAWQQHGGQAGAAGQGDVNAAWNSSGQEEGLEGQGIFRGRLEEEVEHNRVKDVERENSLAVERGAELWSSLAESNWASGGVST